MSWVYWEPKSRMAMVSRSIGSGDYIVRRSRRRSRGRVVLLLARPARSLLLARSRRCAACAAPSRPAHRRSSRSHQAWRTPVRRRSVDGRARHRRRPRVLREPPATARARASTADGASRWTAENRAGAAHRRRRPARRARARRHRVGARPATGSARWKARDGSRGHRCPRSSTTTACFVAGDGIAAARSGRRPGGLDGRRRAEGQRHLRPSAAPLVITGEADGTLRCRDAATGNAALDLRDRRRRPAAPALDDGRPAPVRRHGRARGSSPSHRGQGTRGLALEGRRGRAGRRRARRPLVLFATQRGRALRLQRGGGNLSWRAALPSRPRAGAARRSAPRCSSPATGCGPRRACSSASTRGPAAGSAT